MSSVGSKGVIIQDTLGGDSATVTDGRLDVNALIGATVTVALDSGSDSVECIQDTAADLLATVTQQSTARTVTCDTAANLNTTIGNAIGNAVYTRITNGTQVMPTMDVAGRAGYVTLTNPFGGTVDCNGSDVTVDNAISNSVFVRLTNGTQVMPTMDTGSRAGFMKISDGTEVVNVTTNNELEVHIESIDGNVLFTTRPLVSSSAQNSKVSVLDSSTEICDNSVTRLSYTIVNDSDTVIYLAIEDAAVLNEGIRLNPNGGSFSDVFTTDKVFGICAVSGKNVTVCQQFI